MGATATGTKLRLDPYHCSALLTMKRKFSQLVGPIGIVAAMSVSLALLRRELNAYHYHDIMGQVWTLPHAHIALAIGLTVLAYLVLPGYDAVALSYIGRR